MRRQRLEQGAGQAELPFGRLIGIGGGADDQRGAGQPAGIERAGQHRHRIALDQDPPFERLPPLVAARVAELLLAQNALIVRALDGVAMGIARVAVGAAEFAADVRIDRPEAHAGSARASSKSGSWGGAVIRSEPSRTGRR